MKRAAQRRVPPPVRPAGSHHARSGSFIPHLAFVPCPGYPRCVKRILPCVAFVIGLLLVSGCAGRGGKRKSSARLYEGDSSPNIRLYEERPGYPLNSL
jgi:hypothetical protein